MQSIFNLCRRLFGGSFAIAEPSAPIVITKSYVYNPDFLVRLVNQGFVPIGYCCQEKTTKEKFTRLEIQQGKNYRLFWVVNSKEKFSEPLLYAVSSKVGDFFDCPSYVRKDGMMLHKVLRVFEEFESYNKFIVSDEERADKTLAIAMLSGLVKKSHELQDVIDDLILLTKGRKGIEKNSLLYYYELLMHGISGANFYKRCSIESYYEGVFLWKILLNNGFSLLDKFKVNDDKFQEEELELSDEFFADPHPL
jgi:hypothetical protein